MTTLILSSALKLWRLTLFNGIVPEMSEDCEPHVLIKASELAESFMMGKSRRTILNKKKGNDLLPPTAQAT